MTPFRTRLTLKVVPPMSAASTLGSPIRSPMNLLPTTPAAGPDSRAPMARWEAASMPSMPP